MKRISRSTRAIAVAVVAGLALSGCGGSQPAAPTEKMEVWARSGPEASLTWTKILEGFTKETGIEVDFQGVPEFDTQLQSRAQQRNLPDVWINDAGSLGQYAAQGFITPVDRASFAGNELISDASWEQNKGRDGATYGLPFSRQANVLVVRKDWREKLGIAPPKTWDDLSNLAVAFANQDPDGDGKADTYGQVVPGSAASGYIYRWGSPFLFQAGGDVLDQAADGTYSSVVNSPGNAQGIEYIRKQFCTPGAVVPGSINFQTRETPFFADGTAGIYLTGAYLLGGFDSAVGRENVEALPLPDGPLGNNTTFAEGENIYFGAGSNQTENQKKLAEYLIGAAGQTAGITIYQGEGGMTSIPVVRLPVNETVSAAEVTGDDRWNVVAEAYKSSKPFPWNINYIPYRQMMADKMNALVADCNSDIPGGLAELDGQVKEKLQSDGLSK